jgi:hypothetical protein
MHEAAYDEVQILYNAITAHNCNKHTMYCEVTYATQANPASRRSVEPNKENVAQALLLLLLAVVCKVEFNMCKLRQLQTV